MDLNKMRRIMIYTFTLGYCMSNEITEPITEHDFTDNIALGASDVALEWVTTAKATDIRLLVSEVNDAMFRYLTKDGEEGTCPYCGSARFNNVDGVMDADGHMHYYYDCICDSQFEEVFSLKYEYTKKIRKGESK